MSMEGRVDSGIGIHKETLVQVIKGTSAQVAKGTSFAETKEAFTQDIRDVLVQAAKEILISGIMQNLPFKDTLHTALRVQMEEMKKRKRNDGDIDDGNRGMCLTGGQNDHMTHKCPSYK